MFTLQFVSLKGKEGDRKKSWRAEGRAWNRRVSVQSHGGRNCADGAEVREPAGRPRAAILVTT